MHGINLSLITELQQPATGLVVFAESIETKKKRKTGRSPIMGLRNLFGPPQANQMFTANDRMQDPSDVPAEVRVLMRRLVFRMRLGHGWSDTLAGAARPEENPNLPSGYTYLLQLIAHDMVDSTISLARTDGARFGFANARQLPLALETIYGGGPDTCPRAYEFSTSHGNSRGVVPRTRLRTGRLQRGGSTEDCPYGDVGRARPDNCSDEGTFGPPGGMPSTAGGAPTRPPLTEALIADARNDNHALLSQMTVLFHMLHNAAEEMAHAAQRKMVGPQRPDVLAYFRFAAARIVVTHIWRRIIVNDVLRRILHPSIYSWYTASGNRPVDAARGVPLEFSHGAFRFGHAMVRESYKVNSKLDRDMNAALTLSTQRTPGFLPVTETWHVDWARFFPVTAEMAPNLSHRIAPVYAGALDQELHFKPLDPKIDTRGLASRDLVSACFAGFWSVPHLFGELRRGPLKHLLPDFSQWHAPQRTWLRARRPTYTEPLDDTDVDDLVADPPLPFFVLVEAAHSDLGIAPVTSGGGRHLGPLGSIIVAETILGAIRDHPISFENEGATLTDRLRRVGRELIGDEGVFVPLGGIEDMPTLIRFMISSGALGVRGPG
jgi:hypothetical protein